MSSFSSSLAAVEETVEGSLCTRGTERPVYRALLVFIAIAIGLLPVVEVSVSARADGVIRPVNEQHEVHSSVSGFIEAVLVKKHDFVEQGVGLIRVRSAPVDSLRAFLTSQLADAEAHLHDLTLLTRDREPPAHPGLQSLRYREELSRYQHEHEDIVLRQDRAARELARMDRLAAVQLVARSDAEALQFELSRLHTEQEFLLAGYRAAWSAELENAQETTLDLRRQLLVAEDEADGHLIRAPVRGTIEQLASVSPGSFVQAGQQVAVVSPATQLVAEVFVSPARIGSLRLATETRLLIDAFDYHDWGFIPGRVAEIGDDFVLVNGAPMFRVTVDLLRTHLQPGRGRRGELRKGMTLQARFILARRTLWQLLRADVNRWLDPSHPAPGR
jgi:HlyD family secretion protein